MRKQGDKKKGKKKRADLEGHNNIREYEPNEVVPLVRSFVSGASLSAK